MKTPKTFSLQVSLSNECRGPLCPKTMALGTLPCHLLACPWTHLNPQTWHPDCDLSQGLTRVSRVTHSTSELPIPLPTLTGPSPSSLARTPPSSAGSPRLCSLARPTPYDTPPALCSIFQGLGLSNILLVFLPVSPLLPA